MEIKSGKRTFILTSKDRIMYNGAVYILVTQKISHEWNVYSPTLTKSTIQKLIKKGDLVLCENRYKGMGGIEYDQYRIKEQESGEA